ncbi:DeoR-like protein with HTH domain [Motilibacter rhizosphaerae]|uniref:DeoR-like protein with HTH domain n=1 Tax=Motilibacter rhizosphaerae TaxID=598652 RepID=A0A4Q7NFZ7_9ACTN|nr:DeoR family transcriptional regulator [Motilibacter rhizosphaerae]RZS82719.1 DeoR-like protein with HTH domain [Motilibacter rhizosphaerae]
MPADDPLLPELRRRQIVRWLEREDAVTTRALAVHLGVSDLTIRRDLELLDREGALCRVHGGALSLRLAPLAPDRP